MKRALTLKYHRIMWFDRVVTVMLGSQQLMRV